MPVIIECRSWEAPMQPDAEVSRALQRFAAGEIHRRDLLRSLERLLGGYAAPYSRSGT
jgi:hypothetical protein